MRHMQPVLGLHICSNIRKTYAITCRTHSTLRDDIADVIHGRLGVQQAQAAPMQGSTVCLPVMSCSCV